MKKKRDVAQEMEIKKENIITKLRLWRIERALGVRLSEWQREYVFCADWNVPPQAGGRRSGKTLAVNVKILMFYKGRYFIGKKYNSTNPMWRDPDYGKNKAWHIQNLKRDWEKCKAHKIKVFEFTKRTNELL